MDEEEEEYGVEEREKERWWKLTIRRRGWRNEGEVDGA